MKAWTESDIRALAKRVIDGKEKLIEARGEYLRALIATAQIALGGKAGQPGQRAAIKAAHDRFYPEVKKAIATDAILIEAGFARKDIGLERNRRLNFARSAYGTIRRWLRAEGHDLMKLDPDKVTKSQLLNDAPPTRPHALTPKRIKAGAAKRVEALLSYTRQIAKADQEQANAVAQDALNQLIKFISRLGVERKTTTDARVAAKEMRPLRVGGDTFWHVNLPIAK